MNKTRTKGMTAVAVVNFVFGALGVFAGLWAMMTFHAVMSRSLTDGKTTQVAMAGLGMALYGVACGIVAIIAGIGVLKLAPWGRILSLSYAGLSIVSSVVSLFMPTIESSSAPGAGVWIGKTIGFLLGMIYPAILFIVFRRPHWKEAFSSASQNVANVA